MSNPSPYRKLGFVHDWFLITELVKRDFKARYNQSILGVFWCVLQPTLTMVLLYAVFSIKINRGEAVGLIGRNGAGKSTLLKMVNGIIDPTLGKISVRGQVAPLLALGNGLDPTLTGRENIYLNGAILGYTKEYLKDKEESIIEFSELGDFIDSPVRAYSSGMMMRLAFSIATAASPEILILDEVLAVGDAAFQAKCNARIDDIIKDGTTVFFVSHNLNDIEHLCKRVIWLKKGKNVMDGNVFDVTKAYQKSIA